MTCQNVTVVRDAKTGRFVKKADAKKANVFYEFVTLVRVGNRIRAVV